MTTASYERLVQMPRERPWADAEPAALAASMRSVLVAGQRLIVARAAPGLHVVATPIGHLDDITLRALKTLAGVDLVACEDTRVTGKLMTHYGIDVAMTPYHEHNAAAQRPKIIARLAEGAAIALVSDAGTPLVSDPGFRLVRESAAAGYPLMPVPGPSAALAALVVAGLPTDCFFFAGFLPSKSIARRGRIDELAHIPSTLVFFETGPRIGDSLRDLFERLGPRMAAMCRELTKLHETVERGQLDELAHSFAGIEPKGEIVLVVGPPLQPANAPEDVEAAIKSALSRLSVKDATAEVALAYGLPRRDVYARALELKRQGP